MKYLSTLTVLLIVVVTVNAQEKQTITYPLQKDVATLSGIITAGYEVVSGEAGSPRQWERDKSLHSPNAILSYIKVVDGKLTRVVLTVEEYQNGFSDDLKTGFFEKEINREIRVFGTIAHAWSTYEYRFTKDGPVIGRGINSIQLYYKDNRWWILSWNWDEESDDNKIPASFDKN